MPKTRREFSPEFKREAVALLESSGRPLMQVATEVGISPSMLRNWRALVRGGAARSRATGPIGLSGGWFVTGDLPPYNPRLGTFAQPRVERPVFDGGPGAIELLARYENIDYSGIPNSTQGWAATAGMNWYLDSIIRLQFNLIHWNTENRAGAFTGNDNGQTVSAGVGVTF